MREGNTFVFKGIQLEKRRVSASLTVHDSVVGSDNGGSFPK